MGTAGIGHKGPAPSAEARTRHAPDLWTSTRVAEGVVAEGLHRADALDHRPRGDVIEIVVGEGFAAVADGIGGVG